MTAPENVNDTYIDRRGSRMRIPTETGFYKYSGGNQVMIFLLQKDGDDKPLWYVLYDNVEPPKLCHWDYIEQSLGVYDLVKL